MALDRDGQVWVWGQNAQGQFGNGVYSKLGPSPTGGRIVVDDKGSSVPVRNGLDRIKQIAAAGWKSYAVSVDGHVYQWGGAMQLDDPTMSEDFLEQERAKLTPQVVIGLNNISSVIPNNFGSFAVDAYGDLWFWGGEIINSNYEEDIVPKQINGVSSIINFHTKLRTHWTKEQNGTWKQWGFELFDVSGLNPTDPNNEGLIPNNSVPVSMNQLHDFEDIVSSTLKLGSPSLVGLKEDGTVWTWGDNTYGQLGVDHLMSTNKWIEVSIPHKIMKIVTSNASVFAITEDGQLYSWGHNAQGQLGHGSASANRAKPMLIPEFTAAQPQTQDKQEEQSAPMTSKPAKPEPNNDHQPATQAVAQAGTTIFFNGTKLNTAAKSISGNTMVPFRELFEAFDMDMSYDQKTKTVNAHKEGVTIQLTVGSRTAYYNNEIKQLTIAPVNDGGKIFVNLRFISETLGADVQFRKMSQSSSEVRITYN